VISFLFLTRECGGDKGSPALFHSTVAGCTNCAQDVETVTLAGVSRFEKCRSPSQLASYVKKLHS